MLKIKPILSNKVGYRLRLANGQGWHIIATEGVQSWVEKLASIMELEPGNGKGYPRLIFIQNKKGKKTQQEPIVGLDPKIREDFPKSGWEARESHAIRIWSHHGTPDIFCEIGYGEGYARDIFEMLLAIYPIFERAQNWGALPLHAALLERNGIGVLLVASSDTGKTTCCSRLRSPWRPLCDDETLIVQNHQKRYLAHPFPTWSDYIFKRSNRTWNIEYHLPLSAIFFLEQSETDEVLAIGQGEAAVHINHSARQVCCRRLYYLGLQETKSMRTKLFENACEFAKVIPAFKLRVSLKGRFWEKIEAVLP